MQCKFQCLLLLSILFFTACDPSPSNKSSQKESPSPLKKILYVDSYHQDYLPNTLTRKAFEKKLKNYNTQIEYRFLNAKHQSKDSIAHYAKLISNELPALNPDLIVISDDAAMNQLVKPYLLTQNIPIIFVGVNWNTDIKAPHITGQLEVELLLELIKELKKHAKGSKIGILTANTLTDIKSIRAYENDLGVQFEKKVLVDNFSEWKDQFTELQRQVDILILRQNAGIAEWDTDSADEFVLNHTRIPTGSTNQHMQSLSLLTMPKMNGEFGEFAGKTAQKIFSGIQPADIPKERNKRSNITINTEIAKKMNVLFPQEFLEIANLYPAHRSHIVLVNSYHKGYQWSDGIERGLIKSLGLKKTQTPDEYANNRYKLNIFYMNAKKHPADSLLQIKAIQLREKVEKAQPDILLTSDDAAAKWFLAPFYNKSSTPALYCGVNWDASVYNLSEKNIRGMTEISPVKELVTFLEPYSKGKRVSYLGADILSERKEIDHYKNVLNMIFQKGALVKTVQEWKDQFLILQKSSDVLLLTNYTGIPHWDSLEMQKFIFDNTQIPTGTTSQLMSPYALLAFSRVPEEQGLWLGKQIKKLNSGIPISAIRDTHNVQSTPHIHTGLMKKLNIRFPAEMLDTAFLATEEIVQ
jgi:ABC-type uncharacterized transport system substrate-binding protein